MEQNNIPKTILLPVFFSAILIAWGMYLTDLSPLFSLIGFRIYIPFLPLLYIIFLRFRSEHRFIIKPFPWKTALVIISGNLLIAWGGWFTGLLKYRLPDFHFELAASSMIDFPVYFIWCTPVFAMIWFGLIFNPDSLTGKPGSLLVLLLIFSPLIYSSAIGLKELLNAIPLITIVFGLTGFALLSKSMLHFAVITFSTVWILLLLYGTEYELLLNTFLAYRYDKWDGFFAAKDELVNYFRAGGVLFSLLVSGIAYKRIK
ncbi:MAG: hypothetical protein AMXMBFR48_09510 [Ignavibacteriales bacterium]